MNRAHATPRGHRQEPLYDPDVPTPSHAERARTLVAAQTTGTLATLARDPEGHPYGSFVTYALAETPGIDGSPIFLFSEMAEHTRNLRGDARASLLVAESGTVDPLANGRVTLVGTCRVAGDEDAAAARDAYLERFASAASYAGFGDFAFWRLEVESVRYIGGFGRMSWVSAEDWTAARPDPLAPHAARIIDHMNADHRDAMVLMCRAFTKASAATAAVMTGIDRYGFELSVEVEEGMRPIRLAFAEEATTPDAARQALIARVDEARGKLGEG